MCPSRSVRVTCSIGGDGTWVGSEVTDAWPDKNDGYLCSTGAEFPTLVAACRARWALVKALVLGGGTSGHVWQHHADLVKQRDAVYSALADMALAEMAALRAQYRADEAFPSTRFAKPGDADHRALGPSVNRLARFVEYLVEKVGVL